jgi:hypothetical protein
VMTVKRGYRNVRFEGGKEGIAVAFRDEFPALIDELEKAVLAGELDGELADEARTSPGG